ncbi:MAG: flagellar basal body L-ring protein FlgH [Nitrospinae bacterium]|nr:flagellar basal body L-ring protein FlgH [Nitrospinota bacterium]
MRYAPKSAALLAALVLMALASCSTPPPPRVEVDIEPEKQNYQKGSLWPGAGKKNMFFADNKAHRVGDIVTVQVIEKTTAINKADTVDERGTDAGLTIDTGGANPTQMDFNGGLKFRGKGSTGRSDQFSATVSCLITEVLPNGNMRIEGQRRMKINNEEQYIIVRGLVRQDDITYNTTVISTKIAEADILYTGEGGMDGGREPGWLGKVFNKVFPF